jgi:hypothetical protein
MTGLYVGLARQMKNYEYKKNEYVISPITSNEMKISIIVYLK